MGQRVSAIARHLSIDSTGERDRMVPIDAEVSTFLAQPTRCSFSFGRSRFFV